MRLIFTTLILFAQTYSVAQLAQSEHFGILQFAYCNGNEQQVFSWEQGGETKYLKMDLGSATAVEAGLGFRLIRSFFSEATISYYVKRDLSTVNDNGLIYQQGFIFNRLAFNIKGNYILPITPHISLNFKGGLAYYLPQECIVYYNNRSQNLQYTQNTAPFVSFGFNIEKKWLVTRLGLRYKAESHELVSTNDTYIANPTLQKPNLSSIDVCLSALILF